MKLLVLFVLVAFANAAPSGEMDLLTAFDFEALFNNEEQRKIAFGCLLETESCGDFKPLKDSVIKVVSNKCAECTPEQKAKYDQVMQMFHDKFEPVYNEVMKKIAEKKE